MDLKDWNESGLCDHDIARAIVKKWCDRIGIDFHPDTRPREYAPPMSREVAYDYDTDMFTLFELDLDPHAVVIEGFEARGWN
jgi:hypothetical protein